MLWNIFNSLSNFILNASFQRGCVWVHNYPLNQQTLAASFRCLFSCILLVWVSNMFNMLVQPSTCTLPAVLSSFERWLCCMFSLFWISTWSSSLINFCLPDSLSLHWDSLILLVTFSSNPKCWFSIFFVFDWLSGYVTTLFLMKIFCGFWDIPCIRCVLYYLQPLYPLHDL